MGSVSRGKHAGLPIRIAGAEAVVLVLVVIASVADSLELSGFAEIAGTSAGASTCTRTAVLFVTCGRLWADPLALCMP